jgi:hypothetical protein
MTKKLSWSEVLELNKKETPPQKDEPQKLFFEDFTPEELEQLEELENRYYQEIEENRKYYYYLQNV